MLLREEEEFNLGDYAQKVGDALGKTAYTVGRGIPQIGTGMIDLFGLPFTMSGMIKPENVIGSTDYVTKLGLLPEQSKGIFGQSSAGDFSDALLGSLNPTAAAKTAILATAPLLKDYVQQIGSQGKNIYQQGADLSKDMNQPMLSKMYGKGGGGGLLSNFDDIDELGYYSPTLRSVENINQPSGTGEQFLSMLKKDANVKQEELDWIGLPDFLTRKKQFTKEEVMDFVKDNTINLKREKLIDKNVANQDFMALDPEQQSQMVRNDAQLREMVEVYGYDIEEPGALQLARTDQLINFAKNNIKYDSAFFSRGEAQDAFNELREGAFGARENYSPLIKEAFGKDPIIYDDALDQVTFGELPIGEVVEKTRELRNLINKNKDARGTLKFTLPLPPDLQKAINSPDSPIDEGMFKGLPFAMTDFLSAYQTGKSYGKFPSAINYDDKAFKNLYDENGKLSGFEMHVPYDLSGLNWLDRLQTWEEGFDKNITDEDYANWFDENDIDIANEVHKLLNDLTAPTLTSTLYENDFIPYSVRANNDRGTYSIDGLGKDFLSGEDLEPKLMFDGQDGAVSNIEIVEPDDTISLPEPLGDGKLMKSHGDLVFSEANNDKFLERLTGYPRVRVMETGGLATGETGYPDYTFKQKDVETAPGFKVYGYRMDPSDTYPTGAKQAEVIAQTQMGGHFDVPPDVMGVEATESGTYGLAHLRFTDRVVNEFPNEKALFVEEIQSDYHKASRGQRGAYESQVPDLEKREDNLANIIEDVRDLTRDLNEITVYRDPLALDREGLLNQFIEKNQEGIVDSLKDAYAAELSDAIELDKPVLKETIKQLSDKNITFDEIREIITGDGLSEKQNKIRRNIISRQNYNFVLEPKTNAPTNRKDTKFIHKILEGARRATTARLDNVNPDAPFKKEHEFGVKETLKLAVEEGYDRAVFPTVDSVQSHSSSAPTTVYKKANDFIKKYAKKIGAKVETVTMTDKSGSEYKFLSIPITPELREFIQKVGQPIVQQQNNMGIFAMNEPMSMGIM